MRKYWSGVFIIIVLTLLIFGKSITYEFLNYDDPMFIYENPNVKEYNWDSIKNGWQNSVMGLYIPLTSNLWTLQTGLSSLITGENKPSAAVFHGVSVFLHMLNGILVFFILLLLVNDYWGSLLGALIFSLHPFQVNAVAWISCQKDLLSAFFALISILIYIYYCIKEKRVYFFISTLFFMASILSKPSSIALAPILFFLNYFFQEKCTLRTFREPCSWGLLALPIIIITKLVQPAINMDMIPGILEKIRIAGDALFFYAKGLLGIFSYSPDYGRYPKMVLHTNTSYFSSIFAYALLFFFSFQRKKKWILSLAIFFFALLPVLGFFTFKFQNISTVGSRYIYFSLLGFVLALSNLLAWYKHRIIYGVISLFLLLCTMQSFLFLDAWKNSRSLFEYTLDVNPKSFLAHNNLGIIYDKQNNRKKAIFHYEMALKLRYNLARTHHNLAVVLERGGKREEATIHFLSALELSPKSPLAHYNVAIIFHRKGDYKKAIYHYEKTLEFDKKFIPVYQNLAYLFYQKHDLNKAEKYFALFFKHNQNNATAAYNLAKVLEQNKKYDKAIFYYKKAVTIKKDYKKVYNALARLHKRKKSGKKQLNIIKRL